MITRKILLLCFGLMATSALISQTKYQLTIINCSLDRSGTTPHYRNFEKINIYDTDTNKKIKYKESHTLGDYTFSTKKRKVKVELVNIYKQKIDTILVLNKEREYSLCEDAFKDYDFSTSIEKSLAHKKEWSLDYATMGCFHWGEEQLKVFYKKGEAYLLHRIKGKEKKKYLLSDSMLETLIHFEKKLIVIKNISRGCTTVDSYNLVSEYGTYKLTDDSCGWWGFKSLKKELELE